jgi:hypothetical protein
MSSNRSSEFEIFTDSQFPNKNLQDREYFEDFVLLIADSVSIHFLSENQIEPLGLKVIVLLFRPSFLDLAIPSSSHVNRKNCDNRYHHPNRCR